MLYLQKMNIEIKRGFERAKNAVGKYTALNCSGPVTVAELSKASTVFALSEAGTVGSIPTQGMDVSCVYVFILYLCCIVFR
jgi:hypothetical protein